MDLSQQQILHDITYQKNIYISMTEVLICNIQQITTKAILTIIQTAKDSNDPWEGQITMAGLNDLNQQNLPTALG